MLFANIHQNTPNASSSGRHRTANDYLIQGISRRIKKKQNSGSRLTAVEGHLSRSHSRLRRACFGPSLTSCLLQLCSALARPLTLLLLAAFLIAAEGRTSAWFISGEHELQVYGGGMGDVLAAEEEIIGDSPAGGSPEEFAIQQTTYAMPQYNQNAYEQAGLLKFITGVIAVYHPSVDDAGETARHIVELSRDNDMDPLYVAALISMESGFKHRARSSIGAMGLMQLRPSTAKEVNGGETAALTDPETNIRLGIEYLKTLERRYRGNRYLALSAYNWGPGNLGKARAKGKEIPPMVRKYASGILERTVRWHKHFKKASNSIGKLKVQTAAAAEAVSST